MKNWLETVLSEGDRPKIEAAVVAAEKKTNAEIVPMIVRRSSSAVEVNRGLFGGALVGFIVGHLVEHFAESLNVLHLPALTVLVALPASYYAILGAIFGVVMARFTPLKRYFFTKHERREAGHVRAELEFYRQKVNATQDGIGILIFISMFERQVVVLADETISKVLPEATWNDVCQKVILGLKNKALAQNLAEAISDIGRLCEPHFPAKESNSDELANQLIVKD